MTQQENNPKFLFSRQINNFINFLQAKNFSIHTLKAYQKDLEDFILFLVENNIKNWEVLHKNHIRKYIRFLYQSKKSKATIHRKISCLKSFFRHLLQQQKISANPTNLLPTPKKENKIPFIYSQKKMIDFIKNLPEDDFVKIRNKLIFEILYGLGLRIAELQNLSFKDINLPQKTITILGKRKQIRILPMTFRIYNLLQKYFSCRSEFLQKKNKEIKKEIKHSSREKNGEEKILLNQRGGILTIRGIFFIFDKIIKNNNYHSLSPHSLRHSIATHLLENDTDIRFVQKILGHKSINTTKIYTQLNLHRIRKKYNQSHPFSF